MVLIIISTWKMQNFLASQFAGKLIATTAVDRELKNGRSDRVNRNAIGI